MPFTHALRRALPVCALALAVSAAPALGFEPSTQGREAAPGGTTSATDLAGRGENVVVSMEGTEGGLKGWFFWSDNSGLTGAVVTLPDIIQTQATICAGSGVMIYTRAISKPDPGRRVQTYAIPLAGGPPTDKGWTNSGVAHDPDIACVANYEVVTAWFEKDGSGYDVRVRTRRPIGDSTSRQTFNLGRGNRNKGLAIATSSTRVYVAWFAGNKLKLTRFSISGASHHNLTKLGTGTLATLQYGELPEIGADGDRVFLAYSDRADLRVRRNTDKGVSFGAAKTLRNEQFPGEIGAYPSTVAVKGSKVVVGAVEVSDSGGKGLGYLSTNGGSSYTKVSTHSSGRIVAGLVKVGGRYNYAEAWDESFLQPESPEVRYRRQ